MSDDDPSGEPAAAAPVEPPHERDERRPARVLVVDDSAVARRKLALAVGALGHRVTEASGGARALELMRTEPFDLTLLDILMPEVDGFEVLAFVRGHPELSDMPVIVVSGLENEPGAVIDAIRLGAVDFLPKAFESALLNARIGAAIARKRNRDRERVELREIGRLTEAAALLERTLVSEERLALGDIAAREDALGRFAAVFTRMAVRLHERERRLRRRLAVRRGLILLVIAGVLFGLATPLSKIAATDTPHPMGLALWVNAIVAALCLAVTAWRGRWPRWESPTVRFLLSWGAFGATAEVVLFQVARFVPASTLSVLIVMEVFLVFAFMTLAGHERASARRFAGLLLGLGGVFLLVRSYEGGTFGGGAASWLLLALIVPACYAVEDVLLELRLPPSIDLVAASGLASLVGALLLLGPVWWFDDGVPLSGASTPLVVAVAVIALTTAVATVLDARLTVAAGAIFASQMTYVITLAGIFWSMLLLGERPTPSLWTALAIMFVGLLLVEPRHAPDDVLDGGVYGRGAPPDEIGAGVRRVP